MRARVTLGVGLPYQTYRVTLAVGLSFTLPSGSSFIRPTVTARQTEMASQDYTYSMGTLYIS
jgi:hypothetical protein